MPVDPTESVGPVEPILYRLGNIARQTTYRRENPVRVDGYRTHILYLAITAFDYLVQLKTQLTHRHEAQSERSTSHLLIGIC